jgi:hypothetical protein
MLVVALAVALSSPAAAQVATVASSGDALAVSLLSIGAGPLVGQRFGHTAFRIRDARRNTDRLYSYGILPTETPVFLAQLLGGQLRQRVKVFETRQMLARYERAGRAVWEQRLHLTPGQRAALLAELDHLTRSIDSPLPFDYYLDNCSTRPRDALDALLGGAIRRHTVDVPDGTLRRHAERYGATDLVLYTSLQILQGRSIDQPASAWDAMFLPERLRVHLRNVTIRAADGTTSPLVLQEERLLAGRTVPAQGPRWLAAYAAAGGGVAGVLLLLGLTPTAGRGERRRPFRVLAVSWHVVAGVLGVLLAVLWTATGQHAAQANQNLLVLNPASLGLAVLLLSGRGARAQRRLAAALGAASLAAVLLHALPGTTQANAEVLALTVPAHLTIAVVFWRRRQHGVTHPARGPAPAPGDRLPAPAER